jgi:hypothetical protein
MRQLFHQFHFVCKVLFRQVGRPAARGPRQNPIPGVHSAACRRKPCGYGMSATMKVAKAWAISESALRSVRLRGGGIFWPLSIIALAQSSRAAAVFSIAHRTYRPPRCSLADQETRRRQPCLLHLRRWQHSGSYAGSVFCISLNFAEQFLAQIHFRMRERNYHTSFRIAKNMMLAFDLEESSSFALVAALARPD